MDKEENDLEITEEENTENEISDNENKEAETLNVDVEKKKEIARELLQQGASVDEVVEKTGLDLMTVLGIKSGLARRERSKLWRGQDKGEEEEPFKPILFKSPKEQLEEWFINALTERLKDIMSNKFVELVHKTLMDNPSIIWDPQALRYHIVQINPRINKYMLDWILNSMYRKLEEYKKDLEMGGSLGITIYPPPDSPPTFHSTIGPPRGSNPRMPRVSPPSPVGMSMGGGSSADSTLTMILMKLLERALGSSEPMVDVPNPFGEGMIKVPASQAPMYYMMKTVMDNLNKNNNQTPKEPEVPITLEDGRVVKMPASQAVYYMMVQQEREKRKMLENYMKTIIDKYSPDRVIKSLESLGIQQSPSPTFALLDKTRADLNKVLDRILGIIEYNIKASRPPAIPLPRPVRTVQTVAPKYTPEEREKKIEEIETKIKTAEEMINTEKEISELLPQFEAIVAEEGPQVNKKKKQ